MAVHLGLTAKTSLTVTDADTALAARSGDVAVLATPRIVALAEETAVAAVAAELEPGETTVSNRVQLDHLQPSAVGAIVVATAKLDKIEGRRLLFSVSVSDDRGLVAAGKVSRVIVERDRFMERCQ